MFINIQLFAGGAGTTLTIYAKNGLGDALYSGTTATDYEVTSNGVIPSKSSSVVWTYSDDEIFIGLSTSPNQSSNPTYAIGDTISNGEYTLYVVSEVSAVTYEKITLNNNKVQVDSAIRDGNGKKIDTNYALKSEVPSTTSSVTQNSTAALTSGGAYTAFAGKQDALPTTTTAGQVLKSTSTAGTLEWGAAGGGGSSTDVQINATSIVENGVANIVTGTAYDASTNKIATISDISNNVKLKSLHTFNFIINPDFYLNTSGQTSFETYGTEIPFIDQWKMGISNPETAVGTVSYTHNGTNIFNLCKNGYIKQEIGDDDFRTIKQKYGEAANHKITVTACVSGTVAEGVYLNLVYKTTSFPNGMNKKVSLAGNTDNAVYSVSYSVAANCTGFFVRIINTGNTATSVQINWVKLEEATEYTDYRPPVYAFERERVTFTGS